jgi:hypothetical protein
VTGSRVTDLLELLPAGLPEGLAGWLRDGLERWQQGQSLEQALELDIPTMDLRERDSLILAAIQGCPGESTAARISAFLGALDGDDDHIDRQALQFIGLLKKSRVRLPHSIRHTRRLLAGIRSPGWRNEGHSSELCPDDVLRFNSGKSQRTGTS